MIRYIKTIIFLVKEFKKIHPKESALKFWAKTWYIPNEELYRVADAISRFDVECFGYR